MRWEADLSTGVKCRSGCSAMDKHGLVVRASLSVEFLRPSGWHCYDNVFVEFSSFLAYFGPVSNLWLSETLLFLKHNLPIMTTQTKNKQPLPARTNPPSRAQRSKPLGIAFSNIRGFRSNFTSVQFWKCALQNFLLFLPSFSICAWLTPCSRHLGKWHLL